MAKQKIKHVIASTDGETVEINTEKNKLSKGIFGTIKNMFDNYDNDENVRLKIKSLYRLLCTK